MIKKIMIFLFFPTIVFSAGLVITSEFNTAIVLSLDNGTKRSDFVLPIKPYQVDAVFAGFSTVQWMGKHGDIYKAEVRISGIEGWRSLKIIDDTIYVGGNLLHKAKGRFQGLLVQAAE